MIKKDDYTWTHKGWVIIKHFNEYNLWRSSDPPGAQARGCTSSLALARYLIDQDNREMQVQMIDENAMIPKPVTGPTDSWWLSRCPCADVEVVDGGKQSFRPPPGAR